MYIGDQKRSNFRAVDARNSALRWMTRLDSHKWAIVTSSPGVVGEFVRLFDAATGDILWATLVGPQFGIRRGTPADATRIYVTIANPTDRQYLLQPSGTHRPEARGLHSIQPQEGFSGRQPVPNGADGLEPPTVANGVVYVGSMARTGEQFFVLDASTGQILWSPVAGASVNAGAAVSRGTVYWGSDYVRVAGSPGNKPYAFAVAETR